MGRVAELAAPFAGGSGEQTTNERLFELYNTYSRRPTVEDGRARATIFKSLTRVLSGWLPADRATPILDIACGEGALLALLRELGYTDLAGCDISHENVEICHRMGLNFVERFDALRLAEMPGIGRYGAIFAMDLVEHLPKPRIAGFVEQARKLLLPGGHLTIQAPNMGNLLACCHLYYDLSHEFGLTEKTAVDLFLIAGFPANQIELRPCWNATTLAGRLREFYLSALHRMIWLTEQHGRPTIPTANLLVRGGVK